MPLSLPHRLATLVAACLAATVAVSAQGGALPPDVQKALEARRAEIDRLQKAARDPAGAGGTLATLPARLRVDVGSIADSRSSIGAGQLGIQLFIYADEIPANAYIRRHEILSAIDDQGHPVLPSTNPGAATLIQPRGEAPRLMRMLTFQAPPRSASAIKSIDGTLEVFVPSEENGSLVKFASLGAYAGKPLSHPALALNEVDITALTKEMYDSLKPAWEKSAASVAPPPNFAMSAVFIVTDKNSRLVGMELRAPDGTLIPTGPQAMSTNVLGTSLVVIRTPGPVRPDAELRVLISVPAAVKRYPFRLENIPLP